MHEMVDRLPADYLRHHRTVRRDLEALEAVGFPLINERVDGQVRWRLMDGFHKIPAMSFSPTELMALVLNRALLKPLEGKYKPRSIQPCRKQRPYCLLRHTNICNRSIVSLSWA
jgi:predicted DNA-binding transcriptional regulator YafY